MAFAQPLFEVFQSVAAATAIGLAVYGFGRALWRWLGTRGGGRLETLFWSFSLGLASTGCLLSFLRIWGPLPAHLFAVVTAFGCLLAIAESACSLAAIGPGWRELVRQRRASLALPSAPPVATQCMGGWVALVLLATLIQALTPPTEGAVLAAAFDRPYAALMADVSPSDRHERFILAPGEIWSQWGLILDGPVAAQLVHWGVGLLLLLATVLSASRYLESSATWLAGALVLGSPLVAQQHGTPLAGLSAAWATVLVFAAVGRIRTTSPPRGWGLLTASQTLAIATNPVLGLGALAGSSIALCGPARRAACWKATLLTLVLSAPWIAAIGRAVPGLQLPGVASLCEVSGPLLLLCLGGLIIVRDRQRLALLAIGILPLALGSSSDGADLRPVGLPFLAIAAAICGTELVRLPSLGRRVHCAIAGGLALAMLGGLAATTAPRLAVAFGWESRDAYLSARQGSYRAATVFNRIRRPEHRILCVDTNHFYFSAAVQTKSTTRLDGDDRAEQIVNDARCAGYDYLLLAEPVNDQTARTSASNACLAGCETSQPENFAHSGEVIPIVEYVFADEYQRTTRYRLWKLQGPRAAAGSVSRSASAGGGVSARPRPLAR